MTNASDLNKCVLNLNLLVAQENPITQNVITLQKVRDLIELCKNSSSFDLLVRVLGESFSSPGSLNKSFLLSSDSSSSDTQVNIDDVEESYRLLFEMDNASIENAVINAFISLGASTELELRTKNDDKKNDHVNQFVIFFLNPNLQGPEYFSSALPAVIRAASYLPVHLQLRLVQIWSSVGHTRLKHIVDVLHQFITLEILTHSGSNVFLFHDDVDIVAAVKCMRLAFLASVFGGKFENVPSYTGASNVTLPSLYATDELISQLNLDILGCREPLVAYDDFVNEVLNEKMDMSRDFTNFKYGEPRFSFLNYPFLLNTANKSLGLYYDNRVRMYSERRLTAFLTLMHGSIEGLHSPYLRLKVRRDHLIEDALVRVSTFLLYCLVV